jgi:hypothetical protein
MKHPPYLRPGRLLNAAGSTATIAFFVASAVIPAQSVQAQNLVQNPGFEDSTSDTDSPGWLLGVAGEGSTSFANNSDIAHTGAWSVTFGSGDSQSPIDTLSQIFATVPMTTYLVGFYLFDAGITSFADNGTGSDKSFEVKFGGETILSLTSTVPGAYNYYSASFLANSSEATLEFTGRSSPFSRYSLDDISVEAAPAPVPGAGGLSLIAGAAMLAGARVRRMRRR